MLTIKFWQNGCQLVSPRSKRLPFYFHQLCCVCTFVWICCRKLWIFDELLCSQGYSCFVDSFLLYLILIVSNPSSPTEEILSLKAIVHSIRERTQKRLFHHTFCWCCSTRKKQYFAFYRIHCTGQTMHQLFIKWQTTFCVSPSMRIGVTIHCIRQPSQPPSCKLLLPYQYHHQPHPSFKYFWHLT